LPPLCPLLIFNRCSAWGGSANRAPGSMVFIDVIPAGFQLM
jgi:hypothetical protein